jgi:hypothetical protein
MFATLLGPLPRPPVPDGASPEEILDACLDLQAEHGLEPLTDGGWSIHPAAPAASWRATADRTDHLVKAVLVGPWTAGREAAEVRRDVEELADAGCRWVEVHEPDAVSVGVSPEARARFADAHRVLTRELGDALHLTLAITGGNADAAGIETILAGAYASLAVDLIDGPDNWRLAVAVPEQRGVICGALSAHADSDDGPELLVWAARYAAGSQGRGMARVGLATSGSLAALPWDDAATKVRRLGEAARIAGAPPDQRDAALDPRAVDIRSAALGRVEPRPTRQRGGPGGPATR